MKMFETLDKQLLHCAGKHLNPKGIFFTSIRDGEFELNDLDIKYKMVITREHKFQIWATLDDHFDSDYHSTTFKPRDTVLESLLDAIDSKEYFS